MFNPLEKEKYHSRIPFYWYLIGIGILLIPFISHGATYGSNFLTGGTCTDSSHYDATTACDKALDNNTATEWNSENNGLTGWIKYDLGSGITKIPNKLSWYVRTSDSNCYVKDYSIQASNDNSTWIDIIATTTQPNSGCNAWIDKYSTSTTAYRYHRFIISSTWVTNNSKVLNEWVAYECTDCSSSTSTESTSTISSYNFMSPELDQLLIYILEGLIVIGVAYGTYKILK